jgi:RHS repeat-associated protein
VPRTTPPSSSFIDDSTRLFNDGDYLPLGVMQVGARLYAPELGRFLSRDPIRQIASSSRGNPYAFAFNDPISYADPSGLAPETSPPPDPGPPLDTSGNGGNDLGDVAHDFVRFFCGSFCRHDPSFDVGHTQQGPTIAGASPATPLAPAIPVVVEEAARVASNLGKVPTVMVVTMPISLRSDIGPPLKIRDDVMRNLPGEGKEPRDEEERKGWVIVSEDLDDKFSVEVIFANGYSVWTQQVAEKRWVDPDRARVVRVEPSTPRARDRIHATCATRGTRGSSPRSGSAWRMESASTRPATMTPPTSGSCCVPAACSFPAASWSDRTCTGLSTAARP